MQHILQTLDAVQPPSAPPGDEAPKQLPGYSKTDCLYYHSGSVPNSMQSCDTDPVHQVTSRTTLLQACGDALLGLE